MRRPPLPPLPLILLLPLLLLLREGAARVFTVGYITGSRRRPGDLEYTRPGLTISGAASLAVAEVNGEPMPPHGHRQGTHNLERNENPRGTPPNSTGRDAPDGSSKPSRPPLSSARTSLPPSKENSTRSRRTPPSAFKANSSAENATKHHPSDNPLVSPSGLNPQVESVKVAVEEEVPFEVETWVASRIPEGNREGVAHGRRWAQAQEIDYGSVVGVTAGGGMETSGGEVVSAGRVFGGDPGRVLRTLGHRLELRVAETYGEEAESIRAAARLWRDGVDAYIGPQETCLHEGRMAAAFNLPMVSYFCTHRETSDKRRYPTFARTRPPDTQISKSVTTLLLHFNWTQVAFLHQISLEGEFSAVASTISAAMQASGISVRMEKTWNGPFYLGYMDNPFYKILEETRQNARVYVVLGHYYEHVGLLVAMDEMEMLVSGEYFVVGVDTEPYDASSPTKYFGGPLTDEPHPRAPRAFRSYLGVLPSASVLLSSAPPRPFVLGPSSRDQPKSDEEELDYAYTVIPSSAQEAADRFSALVNTYMELPPFSFKNPLGSLGGALKIPPEAAYLYDAVHVYARALEKVLLSDGDPRNGTAIAEAMRGTRYLSAMGYVVSLDDNGDAEGNYTVIGRRHVPSVAGGYAMLPVGRLFPPALDAILPELRMVADVDWVGGGPPAAEPECGFHGEKCITYTAEIVGSVAGGVALALAIISLVLYRNWRYEQALDSLLWKVDFKDIQMSEAGEQTTGQNGGANGNAANAGNTNRITRPLIRTSQASLSSNPDAEWRRGVAYTPVGIFRGRPLAVKKMQSPRQRPMAVDRAMKKELKMMRDLRHDNLICFIGACTDPPNVCILTEYCARGSLRDILENEDLKLDNMFIASLLGDIIRGMIFLHDSPIRSHGSLRPSNCLVDSRWVLKIADFGLHRFKREADVPPFKYMNAYYPFSINGPSATKSHVTSGDSSSKTSSSRRKRCDSGPQTDNAAAEALVEAKNYIESLLYRAPELLRIMLCSASLPIHTSEPGEEEEGRLSMALSRDLPSDPIQLAAVLACAWSARTDLWPGTQRGDVYSFALVAYELHARQGPMGMNAAPLTHAQILKSIVAGPRGGTHSFRPSLDLLETSFDFVRDCLKECWHEIPEERPDFRTVRLRLRPMRKGMKANIFDNMMAMMEKYANNLEQLVDERTDQLIVEKRKTDALLYEMLPKCVAEQLKRGHRVEAESYDCVTIYFSDIVGFTAMSAESTPLQVVDFLNDLYTCFDSILENYDVYKVETIGDAYMVVSGLPIRNGIQHAGEIASMSLQLLDAVKHFKIRHRPNDPLLLRIGIHSGPVCAGVVGLKMPRYCLFGDTVNTASRMESNGIQLKIHCSSECRALLEQLGGYRLASRGLVQMKGKGAVQTHWLLGEVGDERNGDEESTRMEAEEKGKEEEKGLREESADCAETKGLEGDSWKRSEDSEGRGRRGCSEGRETTKVEGLDRGLVSEEESGKSVPPMRSSLRKSEWMSEGGRGVPGRSSLRKGLAVSNAHVSRGRAVHQRRRSLESSPKRLRFATEVTGEDSGGELRERDVREMLLDCRRAQKDLLIPVSKEERNELGAPTEDSSLRGEKRGKAKKAKKFKGERKVASSEWCNLLLSNTVPPWRRKGKSAEYLERQDSGKWDEIYGYRRKSRTPTSYLSKNLGLPDPFGYFDDPSMYLSSEPTIPKARSMLLMNQRSLDERQESSSAHPLATPVNKSEDGLIHERSHRIGDCRHRGAAPQIEDGRLSVPQTDPGFYSSTSCESNQSYDYDFSKGERSNFVTPSISVSLSVDPIAPEVEIRPSLKSRSEILVTGDFPYLGDVQTSRGTGGRLRKMSSEGAWGSTAIKDSMVKGSASATGLCERAWENVQEDTFGEEKVSLLVGDTEVSDAVGGGASSEDEECGRNRCLRMDADGEEETSRPLLLPSPGDEEM